MASQGSSNLVATLKKQGIILAMILVYLVFAVISPQFRTGSVPQTGQSASVRK